MVSISLKVLGKEAISFTITEGSIFTLLLIKSYGGFAVIPERLISGM